MYLPIVDFNTTLHSTRFSHDTFELSNDLLTACHCFNLKPLSNDNLETIAEALATDPSYIWNPY